MIKRDTVEMPAEIEALARQTLLAAKKSRIGALLFVPFMVAAIYVKGSGKWTPPGQPQQPIDSFGLISMGICFGIPVLIALVYFAYGNWRENQRRAQAFARDLAEKRMEVIAVDTQFAVASATDEPSLFIDCGEGQILLLQGRYLENSAQLWKNKLAPADRILLGDDVLPNTQFTLIRLPHADEVVIVSCTGKYFAPQTPQRGFSRAKMLKIPKTFEFSGGADKIFEAFEKATA